MELAHRRKLARQARRLEARLGELRDGGRFSESVENLKRGVDALSRGEFSQLQKSSGDELGGGLVESMNRMASLLAERTRKEEIESWRRLVRPLLRSP